MPSNGSSLPRHSPFPDRPSFLADILGQGRRATERKAHTYLLQGCHCCPPHTSLIVMCQFAHCISSSDTHSHRSRRWLCCSAQTFRELNFKLLTASALTIFTAVHVSMMHLAMPATLTTTQDHHRFSLLFFVMYVAHCAWAICYSLKEYSPFLDRQKRTQPGIRATERMIHARLLSAGHRCTAPTYRLIFGHHFAHLSSFLSVCAFMFIVSYCVGRSRVSNGHTSM